MRITIQALSSLAVIVVMGTGCASFSKHRLPEVGKLAPPAEPARPVNSSYQFKFRVAVGPIAELPPGAQEKLEKEFTDTLNESGYFSPLQPGKGGNVHLDAQMENYGNFGVAIMIGIIGGLSLTTIPVWASDGYRAKVIVTTGDGKTKEYLLDDAMTTVIWLPLIVATPFAHPVKVSEQVRKNIYKTLILKMQTDGLLPPPQNRIQTSYLFDFELVHPAGSPLDVEQTDPAISPRLTAR